MQNVATIDDQNILDFLRGDAPDYKGRYHHQIMDWSDEQLEECHDQIQWIFPLHEESKYASVYPILTETVVNAAKADEKIMNNIKMSLDRIKIFLGLRHNFSSKELKWCRRGNHNLLRITRIIRSLRLFGLEKEAFLFYCDAIVAAHIHGLTLVDAKPVEFWSKAMFGEVWSTIR